jgi:tetratricopeptide (TPR) repeat protein
MTLSISDQCHSCLITLQEIISILSKPDHNDGRVKHAHVREDLDRFSLFVGNIGALHQSESSMSIESRLQEANDVLTHIMGLLTDLKEVAAELLEIVSGKREGMISVADEAEEENSEETSEVNELREEISGTITRLFRVSILIRQAAPTDLFAKALSRDRYRFNDQFDIAHVGEKYHKLATKDYAWLRQRLGRAITQRRHYLSYVQDHREKLGGMLSHHGKADSSIARSQAPIVKQPLASKLILDTASRPSFFTKATTVAAERIIPQLLVAGESDSEDDARSYTTISRSIDGDHESSTTIRIPKLDDLRIGNKKEFECPFCFRIKKFKSERIWRKHVFSDLRPYVCTFPDCNAPYFGDINRWFQHEMTFHRVVYRCFLCPNKVYYQEKKYLSHLNQEHAKMLDVGGEQQGRDLARKPLAQIPASDCPCCSDWVDRLKERMTQTSRLASNEVLAVTPTVFKRHLAGHLEQLALFAVPLGAATDDDNNSNAAMEEGKSKRTYASQLSTLAFASLPDDLEDAIPETEVDAPKSEVPHAGIQVTEIDTGTKSVRAAAVDTLGNQPKMSNDILTGIIAQLEDEDYAIRAAAIDTLGNQPMMSDNILTAIAARLEDEDYAIRAVAVKTLGNQPKMSDNVLEAIAARLEDENYSVRATAIKTLGNQPAMSDNILTAIAARLEDEDYSVRATAVETLDEQSTGPTDEETEAINRQTLAQREKVLGREHPSTLASMNNLAQVLGRQGKYKEAEAMNRQTLAQREQVLGREHPDTLASMSNLAFVLDSQGKYEEAEVMSRKTLALYEKMLGREHPDTLTSMGNLAFVLESQGKCEEAEAIHRQTLAQREQVLGREHPDTLTSMGNLAFVPESQGKYEEVEAIHRQTLAQREQVLGREHPDTLTSMGNLAFVLESQGKYEEAEAIHRQTLAQREQVLGREHPDTLTSMGNLAFVLESQGKYEEAEAIYRQMLAQREKVLGREHPSTLASMSNLAQVLGHQGKYEEAEAMQRQTLALKETMLGPVHPDTLASVYRLAQLLTHQHCYHEALVLYERASAGYQDIFGQHHPTTQACRKHHAEVLALQEQV